MSHTPTSHCTELLQYQRKQLLQMAKVVDGEHCGIILFFHSGNERQMALFGSSRKVLKGRFSVAGGEISSTGVGECYGPASHRLERRGTW